MNAHCTCIRFEELNGAGMPYCCESVLVPERANDESHKPALLKPAHGQLGTQCEEMTHLIQVEGTLT